MKDENGNWISVDSFPEGVEPFKLVLPPDLKWQYYIVPDDHHNLYRKVWFFDRFTLQNKNSDTHKWEFIPELPQNAIQLTPEVVRELLTPILHWHYYTIPHRNDILYKIAEFEDQHYIYEKHEFQRWKKIQSLPEDCETLDIDM